MINLDSASVINVLSAAYNRLKKKGISKYSDGKIDNIYEILAEFAEEIGTNGLLKAIITMYIPSAIASSKSITIYKWFDYLNENSLFLSLNAQSVFDLVAEESESDEWLNEIYESMSNDAKGAKFSEVYSWNYVQKVSPETTKDEYDEIAKLWNEGYLNSEVVFYTDFSITPEFEEKVNEILSNRSKFSGIRDHLYCQEINWNDLSYGGYNGSIIQVVANYCNDKVLEKYFDIKSFEDKAIINTMIDHANHIKEIERN